MRLRGLPGLALLALLLFLLLPSTATFYTDLLWFREVGYAGVFTKTINAQVMAFAFTFAIVYLFLYFNLRFAGRGAGSRPRVSIGRGPDGRPVDVDFRRITGAAGPVAFAVALLAGLMGANRWLTWLSYLNAQAFGAADPLFGHDVAFYVFKLPVYQLVRQQALLAAFVALLGCGTLYVLSGSFVLESPQTKSGWPRIRLMAAARRHLSLLTALLLGLLAWGAWLDIPSTLVSAASAPVSFGASYADVYARIPFLWATVVVLIIGAALSVWHGFARRGWPLPLAIASYVLIALVGGLYASAVQTFQVQPNGQEVERPYITHNIAATRQAYALDRVEERELSGDAELTARDIIDNAATIENVRLWDHGPLLQTFSQIQEIRTYYDFHSIDNDRYVIDGKYRQVMLSAREINTQSMPTSTWVNQHLTFTHGYGLTLGPVNQVTTEGLPVLMIRDLPPVSTVDLQVTQPSIYYGELTNDYVLVKARQPEFHYPTKSGNENTFYDGAGGVPMGSLLRRLWFAIRFASTDLLVTSQVTPETRILFNRNIVDRVARIAPFLTLDADPYPVVHDGRILWVQDAYTTSRHYPYSTPTAATGAFSNVNYVRNSVKVVTDAYHGSITFYLADPADPLAATLGRVFPGMLRPLSEMPAGLRAHVRYPEDIFRIQADMYTSYHMTDPDVFYSNEDPWAWPAIESGSTQGPVRMDPYYTVMKIPGEKQAEFIQMIPFTPRAKDNLAAWLVARSDGNQYGQLVVFRFPKQKLVPGPQQIVARINQNEVISPQITLWSQQGSIVIQGLPLVIPINESLLYVRPLYLRSAQGRIPELKRVIVAYQDRIVMAETLIKALASIFGANLTNALAPDQLSSAATSVVETNPDAATPAAPAGGPGAVAPSPVPAPSGSLRDLAREADSTFAEMIAAQKAGDWARYGELLKRLEAIIEQMQRVQ